MWIVAKLNQTLNSIFFARRALLSDPPVWRPCLLRGRFNCVLPLFNWNASFIAAATIIAAATVAWQAAVAAAGEISVLRKRQRQIFVGLPWPCTTSINRQPDDMKHRSGKCQHDGLRRVTSVHRKGREGDSARAKREESEREAQSLEEVREQTKIVPMHELNLAMSTLKTEAEIQSVTKTWKPKAMYRGTRLLTVGSACLRCSVRRF